MHQTKSPFYLHKNRNGFCVDKSIRIISGFFLACIILTIGQDYLQSFISHSGFYLSESLLFTLHWLLFIPVCHMLFSAHKNLKRLYSLPFILIIIISLSLFHVLFFSTLIYSFSALLFNHTYAFLPEIKRVLAEDFYRYVLIYTLIIAFIAYVKTEPQKASEQGADEIQIIRINQAGRYIPVQVADILYVQTDHPYIRITTNSGTYLHSQSLSGLLAGLDKNRFVRIHRSAIVHIGQVKSFRSRLNGDYDITMSDGKSLRLSRNFNAGFKQHFSASTAQPVNSSAYTA